MLYIYINMSDYSDNEKYSDDEVDFEEEIEVEYQDEENEELYPVDEEEMLIDIKFNNRTIFENINKINELSNSDYKENNKEINKISRPVLTKYELTKVIGVRMEQIASGMKPFIHIKHKKNMDIYQIVLMELREKKVPFIIKRNMPNGQFEYWKLQDLEYNI